MHREHSFKACTKIAVQTQTRKDETVINYSEQVQNRERMKEHLVKPSNKF